MNEPTRNESEMRRDTPYKYFGAHLQDGETVFRVFAPAATEVLLLREGNEWGRAGAEPLQRNTDGVWSITVPENLVWTEYKYLIRNNGEYLSKPYEMSRIDPFSPSLAVHWDERARSYNSVVTDPSYFTWTHKHLGPSSAPMSIYELHLSTFHDGTYREIAEKIVAHVGYAGFTHVQIMPPFQTPIHESWGYLVGCPYAIYERHGTVDDFKFLVNHLHANGIGIIVDIPMGFGIQDWDCGLANYDGTDLYHHDGAKGWNNQWNTRIYNHGSAYVRDYLCGICTYLHNELGVDGARIDAVAAQIFLDYDRGFWDWPRNDREAVSQEDWDLFNSLGGDRHFPDRGYWLSEAVDFCALRFLRDFHLRLKHTAPNFFTIAEESRRVFPRLAVPTDQGGLGFTYAQNMGEMHRVRKYLRLPPEDRKIEVIETIITTQHDEAFVNPINTHDECANGKTRLITELGNHLQLIGLAALSWFRPGAPMLFQGDEFGEEGWFDIWHGLDWGKTGPHAALHHQQILNNITDLNRILRTEPALARQESWTLQRNGANNENKWFSFVRWGGQKQTGYVEDHRDDIVFVRNESPYYISNKSDVHVPCHGEYRVIYNSIDERYIGVQDYNRHEPYWSIWADGGILWMDLKPFQNLALKLVVADEE